MNYCFSRSCSSIRTFSKLHIKLLLPFSPPPIRRWWSQVAPPPKASRWGNWRARSPSDHFRPPPGSTRGSLVCRGPPELGPARRPEQTLRGFPSQWSCTRPSPGGQQGNMEWDPFFTMYIYDTFSLSSWGSVYWWVEKKAKTKRKKQKKSGKKQDFSRNGSKRRKVAKK